MLPVNRAFGGDASIRGLLAQPHPDDHAATFSSSPSIYSLGAQSRSAAGAADISAFFTNKKSVAGAASTTNPAANTSELTSSGSTIGCETAPAAAAASAAVASDDEAYVAALSELSYDESDTLGG